MNGFKGFVLIGVFMSAALLLTSCATGGATVGSLPPSTDMVWVKGGTYYTSSDTAGDADRATLPVRTVKVDGFWMGKTEVTVGEFSRFVRETGYRSGSGRSWDGRRWEHEAALTWRNPGFEQADDHPVVMVSWFDAVEYCNWRSETEGLRPAYSLKKIRADWNALTWVVDPKANGYRLPTEREWEYAARNGGKDYAFSWGNGSPSGNVADETARRQFDWTADRIWEGYEDGFAWTAPVASFPANDLGLHDMTGNVWEWCWETATLGYTPARYPPDPIDAVIRYNGIARGGSWYTPPKALHTEERGSQPRADRSAFVGFRVAARGL